MGDGLGYICEKCGGEVEPSGLRILWDSFVFSRN